VSDNLGGMAMVNYPYATSFLNPLPAWPVNASCQNASLVNAEEESNGGFNYTNIKRLAAMNFIWQGQEDCIELYTVNETSNGALDGAAWEI